MGILGHQILRTTFFVVCFWSVKYTSSVSVFLEDSWYSFAVCLVRTGYTYDQQKNLYQTGPSLELYIMFMYLNFRFTKSYYNINIYQQRDKKNQNSQFDSFCSLHFFKENICIIEKKILNKENVLSNTHLVPYFLVVEITISLPHPLCDSFS